MARKSEQKKRSVVAVFFSFVGCVLKEFWKNNGLVLASAIAYNLLLSVIPLLTLLLMVLSFLFPEKLLLESFSKNVQFLMPGAAETLLKQIKILLEERELLGWLGLGVLIFFSALAFSVTGKVMQQIFAFQKEHDIERHTPGWLSSILPFLYILVLVLGLTLWISIFTMLRLLPDKTLSILGFSWTTGMLTNIILFVLSYFGLAFLLTSMYVLLPGGKISYRRALYGGASAALLWELLRPLLVWYFTHISVVNVIYGSLTTIVVVSLSFEIGAIIFLLGAQIIAELEKASL